MSEDSASARQSIPQDEKPVLDFLYHDARRIASFLAQFGSYGVLNAVTATEAAERSAATSTAAKAGGGIPAIVRGEAALNRTITEKEVDSAARTYDPLWQNALTLFRYLSDRGLIHEGVEGARAGQFVIIEGDVVVRPAPLMLGAFAATSIRESAISAHVARALQVLPNSANEPRKSREARNVATDSARKNATAALDLITTLPFTNQLMIQTVGERVWCSVIDEFLTTSGNDLTLAYGSGGLGRWQVFGVFDAAPSQIPADEVVDPNGPWDADRMIRNLANAARRITGRPADAYAITPLLIFRNVYG